MPGMLGPSSCTEAIPRNYTSHVQCSDWQGILDAGWESCTLRRQHKPQEEVPVFPSLQTPPSVPVP